MKWENKLKKNAVEYTGTCRRCKQFVRNGMACPLSLPAQDVNNPLTRNVNCPMKVPTNQ